MDTLGVPNMQQHAVTSKPPLSKWWFIGFFVACVVFFVTGGALVGKSVTGTDFSTCYDVTPSGYTFSYECLDTTFSSQFYIGIGILSLGSVCQIIALTLAIIYCVQRHRSTQTHITYVNAPAAVPPQIVPQPGCVAPQVAYIYPLADQTAQCPRSPANPAPHPAATAFRYCGQCGAAVSSPFCRQCGITN